jgi:hypothetical protein
MPAAGAKEVSERVQVRKSGPGTYFVAASVMEQGALTIPGQQ